MDSFVAGSALVALVPIIVTAIAWYILLYDSAHSSGGLAWVVLCLNSASALMFLVIILLSDKLTQLSISRISMSTFCVCLCITVLSGSKIGQRLYRTVFVSSGILTLGWLILGGLH